MRSPHDPATALESLHAPVSVGPATTGPTPTRALRERVVGTTAIALAASVAIQNAVVIWAGAPGYGDPIKEVLAFHAEHRVAVAVAVGLEALNLPLLLGFLTGLHGLVERRGRAGADWSRLAVAAGATLSAVFALYAVLWNGVVLSAGEVAEPSPEFELAWQMHAAAFALALPALGTTLIGAALAAHASRLTPPWQRLLAVAGEACCSPPGRPTSRSRTAQSSSSWGCPATPPGSCGCSRPAYGWCALEQLTVPTTHRAPPSRDDGNRHRGSCGRRSAWGVRRGATADTALEFDRSGSGRSR
ncbi:hypothetical protein ACFQY4_17390 [Catellatospora bangladeshensis]|uniref:hypothetical protein n=1 Tax=Catellatospora bangladeshensis TaxID=310355 RepID=UPI003624048D